MIAEAIHDIHSTAQAPTSFLTQNLGQNFGPTISVTTICTYAYCPRKVFLQRVLGFEEPVKESLVFGSVRHDAYDFINKADEQIISGIDHLMSFDELSRLYKEKHLELLKQAVLKNLRRITALNLNPADVFRHSWSFLASETLHRTVSVHRLMEEERVFGLDLWQVIDPKIQSELSVESGSLQLRGIVDRLEVYSDGHKVPVELKTGSVPREGVWPSHRLQIAAYCLLLEEKLGARVFKGYVHYLDSDQLRPVVMNPFLESEIKDITQNVFAMLKERSLPRFCVNHNKCSKCSLQMQCYNSELIKFKLAELN